MSERFEGLRQKLQAQTEWPGIYMFKFIIPNDNQRLAMVESLFGPEAQVTIHQSRNGNYLSISAKEMMMSADEVIQRYVLAAEIEGLIAL